jgi:hypothetical protein
MQKLDNISQAKARIPQNDAGRTPPFFQPKLSINQPNDIYEQEADAVADKVMRMADTSSIHTGTFFKPAITSVQRKCAHCEEEEKKLQRKKMLQVKPLQALQQKTI